MLGTASSISDRRGRSILCAIALCGAVGLFAAEGARAAAITVDEILAVPSGVQGSGNGTVDLRMFTFSGSEVSNSSGSFDGDNANTTLPNSGGGDNKSFDESYVTTAGDLMDFYALNFGATGIGQVEIAIFLDLNETGGGQPNNTLGLLDIVLNPTTINGSPDAAGDVTGAVQAAIDQSYTGGTLLAFLDPEPAANLPVNAQGAGFADYSILTGIDPFAFDRSDVLLFNLSMSQLSNGGEEIFLSGVFSGSDVQTATIPEPATGALLAVGLAFFATATRRRR
jgi:hypothetical protein